MAGIYIHVPFCEKKCLYCDFYSVESDEYRTRFVAACEQEIRSKAAIIHQGFAPGDPEIASIFFGGGTPSLLRADELGRLLHSVREAFDLLPDPEITVECNPGTVDDAKLDGYRTLGVNRLSFGVQSFHDDDLQFLSRIHTARDAVDAVARAHAHGFENINVDLMFSLPGQTPPRWLDNLERARDLEIPHLSCYSLTVEQGTPLAVMVAHGDVCRPPEESDAELYELTMRTLGDWGFIHYEVSNYARDGRQCRHNLTYWRHEDYFGFGPSAHSTWSRRRTWNVSSVRSYVEIMESGESPAAGGEDLTAAILREEYVYLRLRSEGINLVEFRMRFASDWYADNKSLIDRALDAGLMSITHGTVQLTSAGFLVADELCAQLV